MAFIGQDILAASQFNRADLELLLAEAAKMDALLAGGKQSDLLRGNMLATLFYEPSTRTRMSFEAAMHRLGGTVISAPEMMSTSSAKKGETLYDTGKVVSQYADAIVVRHPEPGSVAEVARGSEVPVINAGDGPNEHPTQALIDLYTILKCKGNIDGLSIAFVGDLKYGRTVHSLCELLEHFDVSITLVSPEVLAIPEPFLERLRTADKKISITTSFRDGIADCDVIYMTRMQKERFQNEDDEKCIDAYVLNGDVLKGCKPDVIVLHPLPRVGEIATEVDQTPNAGYFEQARNGIPVRMALLAKVLIP